jgi:hypothetical protein
MITYEELNRIEVGVTKVICNNKHDNFNYGWSPAMDTMLNIPLVVQQIGHESIMLSKENGSLYEFSIKILNIYIESLLEIIFKDIKLSCVSQIDVSFFERNCLTNDYIIVRKLFKNKKNVDISEHFLEHLNTHCPRVLGVLLSNNKLKIQDR